MKKKVRSMYTDPKRIRPDIPGTVEGNPVFLYHDVFNPDTAEVEDLKARYRAGKVGDVEVKDKLASALNARAGADAGTAAANLLRGRSESMRFSWTAPARARRWPSQTMARVRDAMKITYR